jgi:hypothetical protein
MADPNVVLIPLSTAPHMQAIVILATAFMLYGIYSFIRIMKLRTLIPDIKYWYAHRKEFDAWRRHNDQ